MKQNDWVIANLNNPDFDVQDFQYIAEMNLENTQLLPESYYINNPYVTERQEFKNEEGQFSKDKFSDFYNKIVPAFKEFSSEDQINNLEYSMFDIRRTKDDKVKDIEFQIGVRPNPEHNKIGIEGFNKITESDKSIREISQGNNIYDYEKGEFLNYSVNDISLFSNPYEYFKSLFGEPLVYATYDQDVEEIDPFTGNKVLHKKGTYKLNDKGEYYIETLGGRSLHGKQVVSSADYITSENSQINKYDFFDSDDLYKSVGGNIAKTVVSVLPLFIPIVGKAYGSLLVLRETAKAMPMLYGIATGLSGSEDVNSEILNNIAAYGQKFTTSTSDYAQQNVFSFENFANLASEVVLQFGQQKQIINAFSKLSGGSQKAINNAYSKALKEYNKQSQKALQDVASNKLSPELAIQGIGTSNIGNITEELIKTGKWMNTPFGKASINKYLPQAQKIVQSRTKIGQDLALGYMAIVSNTDVYETVLAKGGTPQEAAAITLGSIIGMYSVDKFLGLGELFFQNEPARIAIREAARKEASLLRTTMGISDNSYNTQTKKGIMGLIQEGINSGRKIIKNYNYGIKDKSLGVVGKAIGEGLEEVSEELVADLSKASGEILGKLGYFSQEDYGAGENAFERYAMSFLGGTMGGGIFGIGDLYTNRHKNTQDLQNDILYLLRQGKKEEIFKELKELKKRGELGSKTLSLQTTEDGETFLTAESEKESQSQKVYDTLVKTINQLDIILNENQLNLSDDQLFDKMVQGEYRHLALSDFLKGNEESIKDMSYISKYQEDYQKLINKIANKESEIQKLINNTTDLEKRESKFQKSLEQLQNEKEELLKERDYLFGEGSLGYVEKTLFAMDSKLIGNFAPINLNQFIRMQTGKSLSELTSEEKKHYTKQYNEYSKQIKFTLDEAFKVFQNIQEQINPEIKSIEGSSDLAESIINSQKLYPFERLANWDTKLEDETDEEYANRNESLSNKSEEEKNKILEKRKERQEKLEELNKSNIEKFIEEFSKGVIDRSTFRRFVAQSRILSKDLISNIIKQFKIKSSEENDILSKILDVDFNDKLQDILLNNNIEDEEKILDEVYKLIYDKTYDFIKSKYKSNLEHPQWQWLSNLTTKSNVVELMQKIIQERNRGDINSYNSIQQLLQNNKNSNNIEEVITSGLNDLIKLYPQVSDFLKLCLNNFQENIQNLGLEEAINQLLIDLYPDSNFGVNEIVDYFKENFSWDFEGDSDQSIKNREIIDYLTRIITGISSLEDEEGEEIVNININTVVKEASDLRDDIFNSVQELLYSKLFNVLKNDSQIIALKNIEKNGFSIKNPIVQLLSKISSSFNSPISIEEILNQIYDQFENSENYNQFELTQPQIDQLQDILQSLNILQSVVIAASVESGPNIPVGHNKAINEFVDNHKHIFKNFKELLTLNQNDANFILNQIDQYKKEINTWITQSLNNSSNKVQKFVKSEQALIKTRLDFYKINKDAFKISDKIDLLEGYESLEIGENLLDVVKIEELIHQNYIKAINSGIDDKTIIETILPKIVNLEKVVLQKTSKLDENLQYSNLTDYDKFIIFVSALSVDNLKFYLNLEKYINDNEGLAPLAIQEFCARIIEAQKSNPELINSALDFVSQHVPKGKVIPWLPNTTFLSGVGGSGKTDAVIRIIVSDGTNTNLSGPTQNQIDNLQIKFKEGKSITSDKLFELILGPNYKEILNYKTIKADKEIFNSNNKIYKRITLPNGDHNVILTSKFKVQKITNPPAQIVIDEATHFSSVELQIIAKFCQENGINLVLAGDEYQNGFTDTGFTYNIEFSKLLTWRCPKLFISLRDNNLQKIINLRSCINILSKFDNNSENQDVIIAKNILETDLKNLSFSYYLENELAGEIIADDLTPELINKIKNGSVVGFVGEESSPYVKQLRESGLIVDVHNPKTIQGSEYDYVVIDQNWKLDIDENDPDIAVKIFNFMQNLYTMISRSKEGTILINNGLSKIVKNIKATVSGKPSPIKQAISTFKETKLQQIQEIKHYFNTIKSSEDTSDKDDDRIDLGNFTGTNISKTEIEEDLSEDQEDQNEKSKISQKDSQKSENEELKLSNGLGKPKCPIRVYGNLSISGLDYSQDIITNENDVRKDLGIFIRKGTSINKNEVDKYVRLLLELKSILSFGTEYFEDSSPDFKETFSKESFNNVEYFINVEEDNNTTNHLIGLTTLEKDKKSISNKKIITLVAKLKDKEGNDCFITLGGLANPETWDKNKEEIKTSIENRIYDLESILKNTSDETEISNLTEQLSELKEYLSNLTTYIKDYKKYINEISKKDQIISIDVVESTGMTDLVQSNHYLRLEDINSTYSEFDELTKYSVISEPFIITDDIKGVSPKIKGKTVVYVSSNMFLAPSELESIYYKQKESPYTNKPMVRMIVLNNEGVSFKSLRQSKYKHIYTTSIGEVKRVNPFNSHKMAIEMYISMWNFRANLKTFLRLYENWISENELTNDIVEEYCNLDNDYYDKKKSELKNEDLDEKTYKNSILNDNNISNEIKNKLKLIWDFNDSLSSEVKQFRLGYNSKHGAYIRKLTNLKEGGLYTYPDKTNGIYINPKLALQYESVLDYLFVNVIDKIIPPILTSEFDKKKLPYVNLSINKFEGWYDEVKKQGKPIYLNLIDSSDILNDIEKQETYPIELPAADVLSQLPTVLVLISKYLEARSFNIDSFDNYRIKNSTSDKQDKFDIKIGEESIDYVGIMKCFGGQVETRDINSTTSDLNDVPGIVEWEYDKHNIKIIDQRLDNLFSLMFHGMISTKRENDFERGDIRATDAPFKYGFKSDHIMLAKVDGKDRVSAPIATNKKLLSSDVIPGFPIFNISLTPSKKNQEKKSKKQTVINESNVILNNFKDQIINNLKSNGYNDFIKKSNLNGFKEIKEVVNYINKKLNDKNSSLFKNSLTTIINENLEQSLKNILNIITKIDENGNIYHLNLEISKDEKIESIKYDNNYNAIIIITDKKQHSYYTQDNGNDEIVHTSKEIIKSQENTIDQLQHIVLNDLKIKLENVIKQYIEEDVELIIDIAFANTDFNKIDLNEKLANDNIKILINSVQNNLEEIISENDSFYQSLEDLKNELCKISN